MNVRTQDLQIPDDRQLQLEIERILAIWDESRRRFGGSGAMLLGEFSIADPCRREGKPRELEDTED